MIEGFLKGVVSWLTGWEIKGAPGTETATPPPIAEPAEAIPAPAPAKKPRKSAIKAMPAPVDDAGDPVDETPKAVDADDAPAGAFVTEAAAIADMPSSDEEAEALPVAEAVPPKKRRKAAAKAKAPAEIAPQIAAQPDDAAPASLADLGASNAPRRFVALDVETANPRYHSICQIGVVLFEDGKEVACDSVLVNPREEFGQWQMRIHAIRPDHVADAPCFADHHAWLCGWIKGETVVSHSGFDPSAIAMACGVHGVAEPECAWIDTRELAMSAWPDLKSHGLPDLAKALKITYAAHDALEDARACGQLLLHAFAGTAIAASAAPTGDAKARGWPTKLRRSGTGEGALLGETVVFTNDFAVGKEALAAMAAQVGGNVEDGVNKRTTMLVVGTRNALPGWQSKSLKHQKAEMLLEKGQSIRIIDVADFMALAAADRLTTA